MKNNFSFLILKIKIVDCPWLVLSLSCVLDFTAVTEAVDRNLASSSSRLRRRQRQRQRRRVIITIVALLLLHQPSPTWDQYGIVASCSCSGSQIFLSLSLSPCPCACNNQRHWQFNSVVQSGHETQHHQQQQEEEKNKKGKTASGSLASAINKCFCLCPKWMGPACRSVRIYYTVSKLPDVHWLPFSC